MLRIESESESESERAMEMRLFKVKSKWNIAGWPSDQLAGQSGFVVVSPVSHVTRRSPFGAPKSGLLVNVK